MEDIVGVFTYFQSARDRTPDTPFLKHGVVVTIKMTIAEVQGIIETNSFELSPFHQDPEIDWRQWLPVMLHDFYLVCGLFHHEEIGARGQGHNNLSRLKQPQS
jgi:hypothetical protein